jgi:hypothetical protein
MMVVVGEIKEIVPAHGAERIVLRHVGDMPFVMDPDMARRFHKRFAGELALWQAQHGARPAGSPRARRLVRAAREGTFDLIEVALMPVTARVAALRDQRRALPHRQGGRREAPVREGPARQSRRRHADRQPGAQGHRRGGLRDPYP